MEKLKLLTSSIEWWLSVTVGRGEMGCQYLIGTQFHFQRIKKFWTQVVVMVAQQCKCI